MSTTRSTIFKGPNESKLFDSDWFDSVTVEKISNTSNGLSFCTAVLKNKEGGMVDKDKDDDVLYCIRTANVFHFKHLWNSEKKVSDIICSIVNSDYEFLKLSKEKQIFKSFVKDQTDKHYEVSPSYFEKNQFLAKRSTIAKPAASESKRKLEPRNQ